MELFAGATSQTIPIFIGDSSSATGAGLTGLVFGTSGLVCKYRRSNESSATTLTLATATAGTWTTSGFIASPIGLGHYELGIPNAAIATGATWVEIALYGATNMQHTPIRIELIAVNKQDTVRMGLTALPNANAAASGGVPVIGTGSNNFKSDSSANVTFGNTVTATYIDTGTAQAGASSTITLRSAASATNDFYARKGIRIISGTGVGQTNVISSYVGSTKVATVATAWTTNPDITSVYGVEPYIGLTTGQGSAIAMVP